MAAVASASITAYFGYFAWGYSGMIKPGFNYGPLWYLEQPLPRVLVQDFVRSSSNVIVIFKNYKLTCYFLEQCSFPTLHPLHYFFSDRIVCHRYLLWRQDLQINER